MDLANAAELLIRAWHELEDSCISALRVISEAVAFRKSLSNLSEHQTLIANQFKLLDNPESELVT